MLSTVVVTAKGSMIKDEELKSIIINSSIYYENMVKITKRIAEDFDKEKN